MFSFHKMRVPGISLAVLLALALALEVSLSDESAGKKPAAGKETAGAGMVKLPLRTAAPLVDAYTVTPRDGIQASDVISIVREHWVALRANGFAAASPVLVLLGDSGSIRYVFKWTCPESRERARSHRDVQDLQKKLVSCAHLARDVGLREVYQGFDCRKFPAIGGIELLKGKCASMVRIAGTEKDIEVNVANGFVLMHRSPGRDVDNDGNREMYVEILRHGGDSTEDQLKSFEKIEGARDLKVLRVGQNKDLPQYGLIRANQKDRDFPATAMWVVHWKIWTNKGTVITDPNTPLIFGPTTVQHYPPVGTEFHSMTGPVDLIHEETGMVVGKLTPKELTAFDIVVTKDDEVESIVLNTVPREVVNHFNRVTRAGREKGTIPAGAREKAVGAGGG